MNTLETLLTEGKVDEARAAAEKALQRDPDDSSAQLALAKVSLFEGDLAKGELFLGQAERNGSTPETELVRANLYVQRRDYPAAKALYQKLAEGNSPPAEASFGMGMAAQDEGDLPAAQKWFERAVEGAPRQGVFRFHLAHVLALQDLDAPQVLDLLVKAIELNPFFAPSYVLLSRIFAVNGKMSEAKDVLEEALKAIPSAPLIHSALTNLDLLTGDVGGAFAHAAALAARFPNDPEAVSNLALLLLAQQRFEDVLRLCEQTERHYHANASLKMSKATALEARKPPDFEGAAKAYEEGIALDPADWRCANNLGQLLLRWQDASADEHVSRAILVLQEALRRAPDRPEPTLNLALAHLRKNQKPEALALAEKLCGFGLPQGNPILEQAERLRAALRKT